MRELLSEVRGSLQGVRLLRQGLVEVVGSTDSVALIQEEVDAVDVEVDAGVGEEEKDLVGDPENVREEVKQEQTVDVTEESFLVDCEDVEKVLEELCGECKEGVTTPLSLVHSLVEESLSLPEPPPMSSHPTNLL